MARHYRRRSRIEDDIPGAILAFIVLGGIWAKTRLDGQTFSLVIILCGLVVAVAIFGILYVAIRQARRRKAQLHALTIANVDRMMGDEFEAYVAELLRSQGHGNVHVTNYQGDYGVDIITVKDGKRWAVQVKRAQGSIGNKAVNEVVGGRNYYKCTDTMVITNSYFTTHAQVAALTNNTTLVDRDKLAEWIIAFQQPSK